MNRIARSPIGVLLDVFKSSWTSSCCLANSFAWVCCLFALAPGGGTLDAQQFSLGQYVSATPGSDLEVGDLDGDGAPDVVTPLYSVPGILFLRNLGGAKEFDNSVAILYDPDAGYVISPELLLADLDGDGDEDVVVWFMIEGQIGWHENLDGLGKLGPLQDIDTGANGPESVIVTDLDGDSDLDVVAFLSGDLKVACYENTNGAGQFGSAVTLAPIFSASLTLSAGDFDGDGDSDLLFSEPVLNQVSWVENQVGFGIFGASQVITTLADNSRMPSAADLDGDGDLDVVVSDLGTNSINWFANLDGQGSFGSAQVVCAFLPQAIKTATADVDGDGDIDVFGIGLALGFAWCENTDGAGNFGPQQQVPSSQPSGSHFGLADLDGNGSVDVVGLDLTDDKVVWFSNRDGQGAYSTGLLVAPQVRAPNSLDAVDMDGDGDLDLISGSRADDTIQWHVNLDGRGSFDSNPVAISASLDPTLARGADLDGDGDMDVFSGSDGASQINWNENLDGAGTMGPIQVVASAAGSPVDARASDLDGDGDLDIVYAEFDDDEISWVENLDGQGSFGSTQSIATGANGAISVVPTDLDQDGDTDVLAAIRFDDSVVWYPNTDGLGTFSSARVITNTLTSPLSVTAADLDGDGDQDVAVGATGAGRLTWLSNLDGQGNFGAAQIVDASLAGGDEVLAVDYDGDGDQDLISSDRSGPTFWYQNDGFGQSFTARVLGPQTPLFPAPLPAGAADLTLGDMDGNGTIDTGYTLLRVGAGGMAWNSTNFCTGDPLSNFSASVLAGDIPLTVSFDNTSVGTGSLSWLWDFGDGGTSTAENPIHTYTVDGVYDVALTVSGSAGSCVKTEYGLIIAGMCGSDPIAAFSAAPTSGNAPLEVQFQDVSSGTGIATWNWDFGDGKSSTQQFPQHTYFNAGTYDVALSVGGSFGSCTIEQKQFITASLDDTASVVFRNGTGLNPAVFASLSDPILGTSWQAQVDGGALGVSGLTFVVAYDLPSNGVFLPMGELLIDLSSPILATDLGAIVGGKSLHFLQVPNDNALAGLTIFTQAYVPAAATVTNALDLVLGF